MKGFGFLVMLLWFVMYGSYLKANIVYPLEIFTSDGASFDDSNLNLYVEVYSLEPDQVDFTFYNESLVDSSIARIYFDDDDGSLLDIADIVEETGTSFSQQASPANLPAGKSLAPSFIADFSAGSEPARPHNGINPGEWVTITFYLNGGTFEDVIDGLNTGAIRIGTHVIALPDGSSGSAIAVPEPGTLMLLGTAGLRIFTREKRSA